MRLAIPALLLPLAALAAGADKEPAVNVRFRALAFSAPITDAAYAVSEDERVPLLITSSFMTGEQRYHGPANLVFTHLSAKDLTETPLASVQLPDQSKVILLFVPDGAGGQAIKVLRDIDGDFPWGTMRFINLTGWRVRILSGGKSLVMDNGADRTLRPAAAHREYAMTEVQVERPDGFGRAYLMRTFQEDDLRSLYFLLPGDPVERTVVLKGIEERKGDDRAPPPPVATVSLKAKAAVKANGTGANGSKAASPSSGLSGQPRNAKR